MSYKYRIPPLNLYEAYNQFIYGRPEKGREILRQYYEAGVKNPRASLYEAAIEVNELNNWANSWNKVLKHITPKKELSYRMQRHRDIINEIMYPQDKAVKEARQKLVDTFTKQHSDKIYSMSEFVINKTAVPEFKHLRRLAKVLFR